jgi:hypothetical protein
MQTPTEPVPSDLDRLVEIELSEIPRVRAALSAWVDDGLLVAKMRALEDEARDLRVRLEIDPLTPASLGLDFTDLEGEPTLS